MKNLIQLSFLVFISFQTFSQSSSGEKQKSKIENVLSSKGEVIFKEYEDVYKFSSSSIEYIEFEKLKVVSLKSNIKSFGLYIKCHEYSGSGISRDGYTFIDQNEIVGLLDFLNFVYEKSKSTELKQTEYIFNTNDFQVFLFNSKSDPKKTFPKDEETYKYWVLGFKVGSISPPSYSLKNVSEVLPLIEKLKGLTFE